MDNNKNIFYAMLGSIGLIFVGRNLGMVLVTNSVPNIILNFIGKFIQFISILGMIFLMFFSIKLILNYFKSFKK